MQIFKCKIAQIIAIYNFHSKTQLINIPRLSDSVEMRSGDEKC